MMKLLVALLLATSAEGLNTKQQVALKKPLLLRGGAIGAKTALLVQTAGLTAFGSEFILSKWASTRYWVCARHCTRKPHNCCVTCLRAQCRGLALTRCIDCSLPTLACALIHDCAQRAYCRTMRLRRWLGSSSPRPLVSGFSASRTSPIARPRLATLRRWRPTARSSPTRPSSWRRERACVCVAQFQHYSFPMGSLDLKGFHCLNCLIYPPSRSSISNNIG